MSLAAQVFTPLEIQRIDAEERALDLITALLSKTEHKRGLTARVIADYTGLAVGYVLDLLKASTLVLRRRPHHPNHWYLNWDDMSSDDKPFCGRKWRPERKRGRPSTKPKVVAPASATPRTDAVAAGYPPSQVIAEGAKGFVPVEFARQLEREINRVNGFRERLAANHRQTIDERNELAASVLALRSRIEELERGEFICKKCGLRKDDEHAKGEF